jgi:translocation and assembly module TamB
MPVDHNEDARNTPRRGSDPSSTAPQAAGDGSVPNAHANQARKRAMLRRYVNRRNALFAGIAITVGILAIILIATVAYRIGFVDRYIAGQVKDTLAAYGIRADIKSFHTSLSPQTVEILDLELYDAQTGERLGKIDRLLATVRIEDLYALHLRRDINLKDLSVEGLELWVTFDAQGQSNFRNIHVPPPAPNERILFAYSTAHAELKNARIHYGDAEHRLSGEARNVRAVIQPDDPNAPATSWMDTVELSTTNSQFTYDGRPIEQIDIQARGRVNESRAEIQDLTLRSPLAEAHLQGVMDDWRALHYQMNLTSAIDLTQASDFLQMGTALRGAGNFEGTVTGEGDRFKVDGSVKSDALAADGVRLQGLNVTGKGSGDGKSYEANGRAVASLLAAGDFQLNSVQLVGGVMGTGSDFRWIGDLRAVAAKSYGTTIAGLILRDARAEYRDGNLTVSAPQFTAGSVSSAGLKAKGGILASGLRVKVEKGVTTATVASAKVGKIETGKDTVDGLTLNGIDVKSLAGATIVTLKEAQLGAINAAGAQTGSINIAGVRLTIHNGRVEGSTNDIDAGTATLAQGKIENIKLAKPVFVIEPSGRYRASADLSIGGGVLAEMELGPAHAALVATSDQIQLNNLVAETLDGRLTGYATIATTPKGASHVNAGFSNIDVPRLVSILTHRPMPVAAKATGKVDLTFSGTDFGTASGSVNAQFKGETSAAAGSLTPITGELAVNADHGSFKIQTASLQTGATTLTAAGQFSLTGDSNLRIDLLSSDAGELQRVLVASGAVPELEEPFEQYGIALGGKLAFNGTLQGPLEDPIVNGHAELGSLVVNGSDVGALTANIASTAAEWRVTDGRLVQAGGGGAQFTFVAPRTGENNAAIDMTLDRLNGKVLLAALPLSKAIREDLGDTEMDVSGAVKIGGLPNLMSGSAELRAGSGKLAGQELQSLSAKASFSGSTINLKGIDASLAAGHITGSGEYDTATKAFDIQSNGEGVKLDQLLSLAKRTDLPQLAGTADLTVKASGIVQDFSTYQIIFDGQGHGVTINGHPTGTLALAGRTENKQLNVTFTTGLLGPPQVATTRIDLSNEKLPATIDATITGADLTQVFTILLPEGSVGVTGHATGTLKVGGNLMTENEAGEEIFSARGLTGTANLTELSIKVEDVQLAASGPMVVDLSNNEVVFHDTKFTGPGTNIDLGGAIATAAGGQETFAINGQVNLRVFNGLSPDIFSSGIADISLRVTGTYDLPRATGTASVSGASVAALVGDQRITVSNLQGLILFNANQAQIDSLKGTLGGGAVSVTGGALIKDFSLAQFVISVHGDNVTLSYPEDFRSTVDADLEIRGTPDRQLITGDVNVRRQEYTKDIELAQLINNRPETSIEEGGQSKFVDTAVFGDLRVEGRNSLIVHNNLGDLVASVSMRLNGVVKDPIISGRITATSGTVNFRNNPYEITRGLVDFPARRGADPQINLQADSVIRGYRVTANMTGPLSNPQMTVSSEPALPQADVVSLILTGTLSATDTSTSVLAQTGLGTAASLLTDTLINAPVSRATNKLFGLSRLEINPVVAGTTSSTPTARLTAARRISKEMTVTYSTNISSDTNQVLSVEYRLSNRLSFVAEYEQGSLRNLATRNDNYSFEIRLRKRF